ncbi:MAG: oligosaccharide flippase family protein [Bdellovibrionota bacterium]
MTNQTNEMILKKGIIVNSIGIVSKFSKAFYLILFSTYLGATEFGVYTYAFAIFDVVCTVLQFGYGQTLAVVFGKYRHHNLQQYMFKVGNHVFRIAALISTLFAIAFYYLIPHVFTQIGHQDVYVDALQIFCFAMPAYALKYNILFSIRATFDTRFEVVVLSMIEPILMLFAGWIVFAFFNVDVHTLCWSLVAVFYVTCAISYVLYMKKYKLAHNEMNPKFRFRKFVRSSYPVAFMEIMNMMMGRADLLVIGYFVNPALVGIYGAAFEISAMITKIRAAIEPTLGSLVQKIHHENDKAKVREWFTRSMFWSLLPTTAIAGFIIVDPNFFMSFFKFDLAYKSFFMVLPILAFGRLFHAVFGLIDAPLYMVDHSQSSMRISLFNFILNMFFFAILIPNIGIWGAAIGYSVSAVLTTAYRLHLSNKIFNIVPVNQSFMIPIAAFGMGIIFAKLLQSHLTFTNYVITALLFIVFASTYFVVFQGLRATRWYKRTAQ